MSLGAVNNKQDKGSQIGCPAVHQQGTAPWRISITFISTKSIGVPGWFLHLHLGTASWCISIVNPSGIKLVDLS